MSNPIFKSPSFAIYLFPFANFIDCNVSIWKRQSIYFLKYLFLSLFSLRPVFSVLRARSAALTWQFPSITWRQNWCMPWSTTPTTWEHTATGRVTAQPRAARAWASAPRRTRPRRRERKASKWWRKEGVTWLWSLPYAQTKAKRRWVQGKGRRFSWPLVGLQPRQGATADVPGLLHGRTDGRADERWTRVTKRNIDTLELGLVWPGQCLNVNLALVQIHLDVWTKWWPTCRYMELLIDTFWSSTFETTTQKADIWKGLFIF